MSIFISTEINQCTQWRRALFRSPSRSQILLHKQSTVACRLCFFFEHNIEKLSKFELFYRLCFFATSQFFFRGRSNKTKSEKFEFIRIFVGMSSGCTINGSGSGNFLEVQIFWYTFYFRASVTGLARIRLNVCRFHKRGYSVNCRSIHHFLSASLNIHEEWEPLADITFPAEFFLEIQTLL